MFVRIPTLKKSLCFVQNLLSKKVSCFFLKLDSYIMDIYPLFIFFGVFSEDIKGLVQNYCIYIYFHM